MSTKDIPIDDKFDLEFRPKIQFVKPENRFGVQQVNENQPISEGRNRLVNILRDYQELDILAGVAQQRVDQRSKGFKVVLDPRKDQAVIQSIKRAFPNELPGEITHEMYRKSLDCLTVAGNKASKDLGISKEDRLKAKSSNIFDSETFAGFRETPGRNRPEDGFSGLQEVDMEEHQKELVLLLFEQLTQPIVSLILSFLPGDDAGGGGIGTLPPGSQFDAEGLRSKVTDAISAAAKNQSTNAFALPEGPLDLDTRISPIHIADCGAITQAYERSANFANSEQAIFSVYSRTLQNMKIFSKSVLNSLSSNILQAEKKHQAEASSTTHAGPDSVSPSPYVAAPFVDPTRGTTDNFPPSGNPPVTEGSEIDVDVSFIFPFNEPGSTAVTNTIISGIESVLSIPGDAIDASFTAAKVGINLAAGEAVIPGRREVTNFLEDLVTRQGPETAEDFALGQGISNTFIDDDGNFNTDPEDLALNILADCIPCADRILKLFELNPTADLLSILEADIKTKLDLLDGLTGLLGDLSVYQDICALIDLLSFQCVPDLMAIIALLSYFLFSLNIKIDGLFSLLLQLVAPLFSPVLQGLQALIDQIVQIILAPAECILDSIAFQINKFNIAGGLSDTVQEIGLFKDTVSSAVTESVGEVSEKLQKDIDETLNQELASGLKSLQTAMQKSVDQVAIEAEKATETLKTFLEDISLLDAGALAAASEKMQFLRLINLVFAIIDIINEKKICDDPKAGIQGGLELLLESLENGPLNFTLIDETIVVSEDIDIDLNFATSNERGLITSDRGLQVFDGLASGIEATIDVPPDCLYGTKPGDADKINKMIAELDQFTI